jgi:hypothetical protein
MPVTTAEDKFYIDDTGALVGPGVNVPKEDLFAGQALVADAAILNRIYQLGVLRGKMDESTDNRLARDRIRDVYTDFTKD